MCLFLLLFHYTCESKKQRSTKNVTNRENLQKNARWGAHFEIFVDACFLASIFVVVSLCPQGKKKRERREFEKRTNLAKTAPADTHFAFLTMLLYVCFRCCFIISARQKKKRSHTNLKKSQILQKMCPEKRILICLFHARFCVFVLLSLFHYTRKAFKKTERREFERRKHPAKNVPADTNFVGFF